MRIRYARERNVSHIFLHTTQPVGVRNWMCELMQKSSCSKKRPSYSFVPCETRDVQLMIHRIQSTGYFVQSIQHKSFDANVFLVEYYGPTKTALFFKDQQTDPETGFTLPSYFSSEGIQVWTAFGQDHNSSRDLFTGERLPAYINPLTRMFQYSINGLTTTNPNLDLV